MARRNRNSALKQMAEEILASTIPPTAPESTSEPTDEQVAAELIASLNEFAESMPEVDEVTEQEPNTEVPPEEERPTRQPGTSNLACTIRQHRHRYTVALAPSGKKTANNGDWVASTLLLVPQEELEIFVHGHFGKVYPALNKGHRRMCCGNVLRAAIKKGDEVATEWLAKHLPKEAGDSDDEAVEAE